MKVLFIISIELLFSIMLTIILFSTQETIEYYRIINPERYDIANKLVNTSFVIYAIVPIVLHLYCKRGLIIWTVWIALFCLSLASIYLV
jgi:hypothetical protein|nr:MAG TPA: hypothetical protein [Caudoviricetes sp.]